MAQPASVITLMAAVLNYELQNRGILTINHLECEEIIAKVVERSSDAARRIERRETSAF
jgi:hypothetical protein